MVVFMFRQSSFSPFVYLSPLLNQQMLAASPLAINGMKLLFYCEENSGISLTQSLGAFHRKCVEWAANEFQWPGYEAEQLYSVNKVLNEPDFPPLSTLHWALQDLRIIRHYKGRAVLTKRGRSMLGHHGELQAVLAEWILAAPLQDNLSSEAAALFWDLRHMLGIIANRLGDWMTLSDFTELALPVDLYPARGPLGPRHEAGFYLARNFVQPLTWLGVLEQSPTKMLGISMRDRQLRRTALFDAFFRIALPSGIAAAAVH